MSDEPGFWDTFAAAYNRHRADEAPVLFTLTVRHDRTLAYQGPPIGDEQLAALLRDLADAVAAGVLGDVR